MSTHIAVAESINGVQRLEDSLIFHWLDLPLALLRLLLRFHPLLAPLLLLLSLLLLDEFRFTDGEKNIAPIHGSRKRIVQNWRNGRSSRHVSLALNQSQKRKDGDTNWNDDLGRRDSFDLFRCRNCESERQQKSQQQSKGLRQTNDEAYLFLFSTVQ